MNSTIENNKLIVEFMGYETMTRTSNGWEPSIFSFHISWDSLMPVITKALKYCHENMLNEWENDFTMKFLSCELSVMYNETLNFIKWYNKNA